MALGLRANLIELVEEDDPVLLHDVDGLADDLVFIHQFVALFLKQNVVRFRDRHAPWFGAAAEGFAKHIIEIDHAHLRARGSRYVKRWQAHRTGVLHFKFNLLIVQLAVAKFLAKTVACRFAGVLADQSVEHTFFSHDLRLRFDVLAMLLADHVDGGFDQIADDLFDVAADIADLGELCRLDFDKGRFV